MSTTLITNPAQVTPANLALELYQAWNAAYTAFNNVLVATATPGSTLTLTIPSLAAIQEVQALAAAGAVVTPAQYAAQLVQVQVTIPENITTPPPYVLGRQLAPGLFILDANGPFPSVGTTITIGTSTYLVGALTPFEFTAQQTS
jgi:hypothetical protein